MKYVQNIGMVLIKNSLFYINMEIKTQLESNFETQLPHSRIAFFCLGRMDFDVCVYILKKKGYLWATNPYTIPSWHNMKNVIVVNRHNCLYKAVTKNEMLSMAPIECRPFDAQMDDIDEKSLQYEYQLNEIHLKPEKLNEQFVI